MPLLAEAPIRTGAQYPYAPPTEPCDARRQYEPRLVPKKPTKMLLPEGLVRSPTEPRDAREHLVQIVQIVQTVQKCVRRTSRVASRALDKPLRGRSNPSPERSGAVDGTLPVEVHLPSGGGECNQARRRYEPAHRVRAGSYQRSQLEYHFREAWYDLPPKPTTRARAHRGVVPLVLRNPQSRKPNPGHTP